MENFALLIIVPLIFALLFSLGKGKGYVKTVSALFFIVSSLIAVKLTLAVT